MPMEFCGEWHAYKNEMPGAAPTLTVSGSCCFPVAGWSAELVPHPGTGGFNPLDLWLDLVTTAPEGPSAEVLTEIPVEYKLTDPILAYTSVTVSDGSDPTHMVTLEVEIVS